MMSEIDTNSLVPRGGAIGFPSALSKAQKAAVILCLLDKDGAAPVFEKLDEEAVQSFVKVMGRLGRIDGATVRAVVAEFLEELARNEEAVNGGARHAMTMIGNYLGDAAAAKFSEGLDLQAETDVWKRMSMVNTRVLAEFLTREHPQSAAVILSRMQPEQAGKVVSEMSSGNVEDILQYFRRMKTLKAESIEMISRSIGKSLFAGRVNTTTVTPAERVGAIMNYTASQLRDDIISRMDETDPDFSEAVKRKMFTFSDIETRIARNEISVIVRAVESAVLVTALAGAEATAPTTKAFILSNISTRMAEMIAAEIAERGTVKRAEADAAQAEIVKTIRELEAAGEIILITPDDD